MTLLARLAPHLAAALADSTVRLDRFDRRFGDAALATFARSLDKAAGADGDTFLRGVHDLYRDRKGLADAGVALGRVAADEAGRIYAGLADAVVAAVLRGCEAELAARHGRVPGGRHGIVAVGSLGSGDPAATSDLDLIFVYEVDGAAVASDGALPLPADHYYARMAQDVFAALGSDVGHGPMFGVDVRLRPRGVNGPIATRLGDLGAYLATEAWTFEAMALTRARVVTASAGFAVQIETSLRRAVVATATQRDVRSEISLVRELTQEDGACRRVWDVKDVAGGLIDIDFILRGLILLNAPAFARKPINDPKRALAVLRRVKALPAADAKLLADALRLYGAVRQILAVTAQPEPRLMAPELAATLAQATGVDDLRSLERELRRLQREVQRIFAAVYGRPRRRDWIHRRAA